MSNMSVSCLLYHISKFWLLEASISHLIFWISSNSISIFIALKIFDDCNLVLVLNVWCSSLMNFDYRLHFFGFYFPWSKKRVFYTWVLVILLLYLLFSLWMICFGWSHSDNGYIQNGARRCFLYCSIQAHSRTWWLHSCSCCLLWCIFYQVP